MHGSSPAPDDVVARRPARPFAPRLLRWALIAAVAAVAIVLAGAAVAYVQVRRSLPVMEGRVVLAGLGADVVVDRDALGVPRISGGTREDVARATGFVHAQD